MCWYCGAPIADAEPLGRSLRCVGCGRDLRVCRHCRHFRSPGDCRESQAEPVGDPERGNFCDWFALDPRYREASGGAGSGGEDSARQARQARQAFERLFG